MTSSQNLLAINERLTARWNEGLSDQARFDNVLTECENAAVIFDSAGREEDALDMRAMRIELLGMRK